MEKEHKYDLNIDVENLVPLTLIAPQLYKSSKENVLDPADAALVAAATKSTDKVHGRSPTQPARARHHVPISAT